MSWLPVLCQNPAEIPPRWLELGGKIRRHPYKGLSAFTENDTEIFFGRKVLTNSLLSKVERKNFVAVIGASGSGKSSLVAAGLIPPISNRMRLVARIFNHPPHRKREIKSVSRGSQIVRKSDIVIARRRAKQLSFWKSH